MRGGPLSAAYASALGRERAPSYGLGRKPRAGQPIIFFQKGLNGFFCTKN